MCQIGEKIERSIILPLLEMMLGTALITDKEEEEEDVGEEGRGRKAVKSATLSDVDRAQSGRE